MRGARRAAAALLLLGALLPAGGCGDREGVVEGTVTVAGRGASADVQLFVKAGEERTGTPFLTVRTGPDGSFRAAVPPGEYHVVARGTLREGGRARSYKGEFAGNPVRLAPGGRAAVAVAMAEMGSGSWAPREGTAVTGEVRLRGAGAEGVFVYAYPAEAGTVRGPAWVAFARTGPGGRFRLPLREGSYRLVARRKGGDDETGAMGSRGAAGGDEGAVVAVAPGQVLSVPPIALHPPEESRRRERAARGGQEAPVAEVAGTVTRDDGSPAPGVRVMAYGDRRMIGRPFAISGATGPDGAFSLALPREGTYYLGARSGSGGPLSPGEWVGSWDGSPDHGLAVGRGERREGLRIRVVEKW